MKGSFFWWVSLVDAKWQASLVTMVIGEESAAAGECHGLYLMPLVVCE